MIGFDGGDGGEEGACRLFVSWVLPGLRYPEMPLGFDPLVLVRISRNRLLNMASDGVFL